MNASPMTIILRSSVLFQLYFKKPDFFLYHGKVDASLNTLHYRTWLSLHLEKLLRFQTRPVLARWIVFLYNMPARHGKMLG